MDLEAIKTVLKDQESSIKELVSSSKIINREYPLDKLKYTRGVANIITGPRRSGKSVFAFQAIEKQENFGYVNFEDINLNIKAEELNKVLEAIYSIKGETKFFLFDEIQNITGWERFISRLVDSKNILLTGSNSNLLSKELGSSMTGRHFDHVLLPFSFREFLSYNKIQYDISKGLSTAEKVRLLKGLEKYLYTGGFPIGIELGKQYLDDLYTDIIFKDVVIRHKIKLSSKMRDLADYLASSSSTEVSYNKLRNIIGLSSKHTIKEWIGFLEEAYLIFILKRFSFKKKETLKYPFKMYSIDPGFIASSLTSGSISKRMEEVVAIELLRRKNYLSQTNDIYYWKDSTNKEIDFLLEDSGNVKQLIQVTYASERDSINQREIDNLITGASKLNCNNLFVITWDYEANEAINGRRIRFIPLWKWLLKPY